MAKRLQNEGLQKLLVSCEAGVTNTNGTSIFPGEPPFFPDEEDEEEDPNADHRDLTAPMPLSTTAIPQLQPVQDSDKPAQGSTIAAAAQRGTTQEEIADEKQRWFLSLATFKPDHSKQCIQCQEDSTVPDDMKAKVYEVEP
jgi:hypothetical protein